MKWIPSWTAAVQGPYPIGSPAAQPDLSFAFPSDEVGADDQTFRLVVKPDIWGAQTRLRFTNVFGTRPVVFDGVFVGLQWSSACVVPGTNRSVTFCGKRTVKIEPGDSVWSDPVALDFVNDLHAVGLAGRKLAVSFHVAGVSGPMTWHAKGLTTSYLTAPHSGAVGHLEDEAAFSFTTTSWYFLNALDMMASAETRTIVVFGDSISDGTSTTLNGDDRWSDVLSRRLHAQYPNTFSIVNAGIGGNQVVGPSEYSALQPFLGGPSAEQRLERDVLTLSNVSAVIWLEGINDFSKRGNASVDAVKQGMKQIVARLRQKFPHLSVIGATLTSALGSAGEDHGFVEQEQKRLGLNEFIRNSELFDSVIDFDAATLDVETGELQPAFVPNSTIGGPGDKVHPNRAGYLKMGYTVELRALLN